MRWRGVHHVELNVLDYDESIAFYDAMFGWLGYMSFWTLDIEYRSTYYMSRFPLPHSYIGIQPAAKGEKLRHTDQKVGINHIALWARSRAEVDRFHNEFLIPREVPVTDPPKAYPVYTPGYYAVFFDDPINGIHWELARLPMIPSPRDFWKSYRALREIASAHPEWTASFPAKPCGLCRAGSRPDAQVLATGAVAHTPQSVLTAFAKYDSWSLPCDKSHERGSSVSAQTA